MASVTRKTASSSSGESSPLPSPSQERLVEKLAGMNLGSPQHATVNWGDSRVFTPGQAVGYRTTLGLEFANGSMQLFHSGVQSQGLIFEDGQVTGASVSTSVHTQTERKKESKSTFIQYDKTRINKEEADFDVAAKNKRGQVNYQGGHLIDHKFSAGNSHTTERNYFPQHYMVNAPLKEYLVQRCDAYVEIPLYTLNPPTIGVSKKKDKSDPIPVGDVLVQISQNRVIGVYYFPNNNFNYEGLQAKLAPKKGQVAATMIPYFKLKTCFHELFRCAIVTDFRSVAGGNLEQTTRETVFFKLMDDVSFGMSLAECDEEEEEISQLAFSVLHEEAVDPSLCLECNEDEWKKIKGEPLAAPFNALGEFLVRYGIRNALKSEVISINSRLVFLNVIIDFIEAYYEVSDSALAFVDGLAKEFKDSFDELDRIQGTMSQQELFYFANTYQRISDFSNHAFSNFGHKIYFRESFTFFCNYIDVLKLIAAKYKIESLVGDFASNFLNFIKDAQATLEYWIETGFPEEELQAEGEFLHSLSKPCLILLEKQNSLHRVSSVTFQSNINQTTSVRTSPDYLRSIFENLGLEANDS